MGGVPSFNFSTTRSGVYWVGSGNKLMELDLSGTHSVRVMPVEDETHALMFSVSPDDRRIAIATYVDNGATVSVSMYTADISGDTRKNVLE